MKKDSYIRKISKLCLETEEVKGGHSLFAHTKHSDKELIDRATRLTLKTATQFTIKRDEILAWCQEALLDEEYQVPECVLEWLDDFSDGDDFLTTYSTGNIIGYGYKIINGRTIRIECTAIQIVLRKNDDGTDFYLVTTYPIEE